MREIDLLVRAAFLYPMTGDLPVLRDAEVAIAGDRIVHAGACMPAGSWRARREIGGPTAAVLPGFVNAHTHTASLVFRGRTDDVAGGSALYDVAFRMEKTIGREQWRDLAWAGTVEMIRSGFTTVNDLWYAPDLLAEACAASGLRAQIANKVFDVALDRLAHDDYTHHPAIGEQRLREGVDFVERWHGREGGRIQARLGPHASDTCSPALHRQLRAEADRLKVGLHIHTAQSRREVAEVRRAQGRGPLEYLRDLGLLGADVVVAHLSFATDADLDAVAATGTNYAHTPTIYPRRGWYPRFAQIVGRGIPTGFATDWMQNDPFEMMRNAVNALRLTAGDASAISCREALCYATVGAARIMGLEDEIGSLAPGKKADLVVIDLDRPHLQPFYGDYAALVFYARADDVVASVIDGRVIMDGRRVGTVDEAQIHRALCRHTPGWRERLVDLGALRQVPDDPQASIRCVDHGELRHEVVQYIADALAAFAALGPRRREQIALEVALLGQHGLDIADPAPKYALKTLPGSYSGLHLLAIMYTALRQIDPAIDVGADFLREYELARASAD